MEIDKEYKFSKQELYIIEAALRNYIPRLIQVTKVPEPSQYIWHTFAAPVEQLLADVDKVHKRVKEAVDNHG